MPEYTKPEDRQFVEDMEAVGLEVRHDDGRNFDRGGSLRRAEPPWLDRCAESRLDPDNPDIIEPG